MTAFMNQNYSVSIPYGDSDKYDFIADIHGKLIRVQVKTASLKKNTENAIVFACRSAHKNGQGISNVRYSADEIDYFATYWNDQCYLIPVEECSIEKTLRFEYPKNGQREKITLAQDYELRRQLQKIITSIEK